jgi:basic membrane protein A and related proteins
MTTTWKRLVAVLAALALVLAACGDNDGTDAGTATDTTAAGTTDETDDGADDGGGTATTGALPTGGDCTSDEVLCIGLVTDVGPIDDKSFNQSAWEGAQQAAQELQAQLEFIQTTDATDYANNIDTFAQQGYDIIITVGFAIGEATVAAAGRYPDIDFIGVDQFQAESVPNVAGLIFPEDQAGFMAGALAGLLTEGGTVAAVLGTDLVPPVVAFAEGYEAGVAHTNPDARVITTYHPGGVAVAFTDPAWGADTARQAIDQGADVIFGAGGLTGNGALAEIAKEGGAVYCIGVDTDQWETVPEARPCLVTSAMKLITPGVAELVTAAAEGRFPAGNFVGEVGLAPYHDHEEHLSDEVITQVQEVVDGVLAGEIETGYGA